MIFLLSINIIQKIMKTNFKKYLFIIVTFLLLFSICIISNADVNNDTKTLSIKTTWEKTINNRN